MLRRVALVRTNFSEECSASIITVTRNDELGTTLAVTSNPCTLFIARLCHLDDGGATFLRKVGSYKSLSSWVRYAVKQLKYVHLSVCNKLLFSLLGLPKSTFREAIVHAHTVLWLDRRRKSVVVTMHSKPVLTAVIWHACVQLHFQILAVSVFFII
jgi:hypothetical protein